MTTAEPFQTENDELATVPSTQPLSQREIRKQFLLDTLQEKPVLLPLAISAISLIYILLYAPVLGGSMIVFVLMVAASLFGVAFFIWQAVIRYQQGYTRKLQELADRFEAENSARLESRLRDLYTCLEQGFTETHAQEGLKILHGLEHEYNQLQPVIHREEEADLISMSNLASLVSETYIQGLNVLDHALEIERAIGSTDIKQLQAEIKSLEQKAATVKNSPASVESLVLNQEKIDFNKERLSMVTKLKLRVDELLHQADRCEASLSKTRIELAALKADASDVNVTSVINTLQKTIERAKEVQAELKKLGY